VSVVKGEVVLGKAKGGMKRRRRFHPPNQEKRKKRDICRKMRGLVVCTLSSFYFSFASRVVVVAACNLLPSS
jgi:hypothetical protein